jgi:NDP-sugar pyrophosphorylase family protein
VGGIFEELRRRDLPVHCFIFTEPWFDIGSFEAYLEATSVLVGDDPLLGAQCSLSESSCGGSVVLGDRTHVSGSTLENVVTFEDCRIENCILRNCILDAHCDLRGVDLTGKMLREGTVLVSS